jgi:thiol-disulfide isomerase/thioredoxin
MRFLLPIFLLLSFASAAQKPVEHVNTKSLMARTSSSDTVYVINFWATWCPPCVAELPEFDALQEQFADRPVKILMVSMDFKEDIAFRVPAFLERRRLKPEVVWFSDTDANKFIPQIEPRWSGSIPATLILDNKNKRRTFLEQTITEKQVARAVLAALR